MHDGKVRGKWAFALALFLLTAIGFLCSYLITLVPR